MEEKFSCMLPDGYPLISLYETLPNHPLYQSMVQFSQSFVDANLHALDVYKTKWGANPVRGWSRQWEYPYVYTQIQSFLSQRNQDAIVMLDAGSGLTFFPHYLARSDSRVQVLCVDSDTKTCEDAQVLYPPACSQVQYDCQSINRLPYPNDRYDLIYCISVLEHCGYPKDIVMEFARLLKPGGRLILTIDISLDGRKDIPLPLAIQLVKMLNAYLEPDQDYLSLINGFSPQTSLNTVYFRQKNPDRPPWKPPTFFALSCFCMGYRKKL